MQALFALTEDSPEAVIGGYTEWDIPLAYRSVDLVWVSAILIPCDS